MTADRGASRLDAPDRSLQSTDDAPAADTHDDVSVVRADEQRVITKPAKTSAAAAFALVFGVAAILSVLTVLLSPVGLLLGIIGVVLGIVGLKMARRTGVTGKGVALSGLVLSLLAVLLAGALAIGVTTFLNNDAAVTRLENQVQKMRDNLPGDVNVPTP